MASITVIDDATLGLLRISICDRLQPWKKKRSSSAGLRAAGRAHGVEAAQATRREWFSDDFEATAMLQAVP